MNTQTTLSITEARKKIFDISDDVQTPDRYYVLTEKGKPKVVLMSTDTFEGWLETMAILNEAPDILDDVKRIRKNVKKKNVAGYMSLEKILHEHGYIMNDSSAKKYGISGNVKQKSKKRIK